MQKTELEYPDASQIAICEKYDMPVLPPEEMVAVALGTIGQSPVFGIRDEPPEGGNVSWYIYCGEYSDAPDFFQPVHVHHLDERLADVEKYLCLPIGARFIIDEDGYEDVWMDGDEEEDEEGEE
ncbi:immunity protein Imm33 domain-containing protein [Pseudomonas sp. EA_5y_Pfl2_R50]|uniref:immunity protein Imm33 domain-containing protein n=1 Tax=Pseudomonas sp. EA_5y_Pfl2_R50 TaxID=3088691 RepID=UPI0030D98155